MKNCLNALFSQEYTPTAIYIIDNNSCDGTYQTLQDGGLLHHDVIQIHYMNTGKNLGGAGGFHLGLKTAHESGLYDAYLLMDDDGRPDKNEIKELVPYLGKYDYINALVIDINDETKLTFPWNKKVGKDRGKATALSNEEGVVINCANPFNGTMVSKRLVDKIGYPKAEMFIYGDEMEYLYRSKKNGFTPITVIASIHRHPSGKVVTSYCKFLWIKIPYIIRDNPILIYCSIRNGIYNARTLKQFIKVILVNAITIYEYNKKSKTLRNVAISAMLAGLRHDFSGHVKFIKN